MGCMQEAMSSLRVSSLIRNVHIRPHSLKSNKKSPNLYLKIDGAHFRATCHEFVTHYCPSLPSNFCIRTLEHETIWFLNESWPAIYMCGQ
jgi:hypothetical protein